jgi:hypothetical protein
MNRLERKIKVRAHFNFVFPAIIFFLWNNNDTSKQKLAELLAKPDHSPTKRKFCVIKDAFFDDIDDLLRTSINQQKAVGNVLRESRVDFTSFLTHFQAELMRITGYVEAHEVAEELLERITRIGQGRRRNFEKGEHDSLHIFRHRAEELVAESLKLKQFETVNFNVFPCSSTPNM